MKVDHTTMDKKRTILIIEDETEIANMFGLALKQAGFKVTVVNEGGQGLEIIKSNCPDLVLLDLVMPDMTGYDVLADLKKCKTVPDGQIYVWSNLTQKDEIDKAKKMGAKEYLIKSDYTPKTLVEKVKELLK